MTFTSAGDVGVGHRRNPRKPPASHHQGCGGCRLDRPALQFLTELIEAGTVAPVIDMTSCWAKYLTPSASCTRETHAESSSSPR